MSTPLRSTARETTHCCTYFLLASAPRCFFDFVAVSTSDGIHTTDRCSKRVIQRRRSMSAVKTLCTCRRKAKEMHESRRWGSGEFNATGACALLLLLLRRTLFDAPLLFLDFAELFGQPAAIFDTTCLAQGEFPRAWEVEWDFTAQFRRAVARLLHRARSCAVTA